MRTRAALAAVLAAVLAAGLASAVATSGTAAKAVALAGLPAGVPPAALAAEPALPAPAGWPFPEAFPQTSGTGRLASGASYWTDFLYDDHGATGLAPFTTGGGGSLAPTRGSYSYPAGPAEGNGADIFRAAVGLDDTATYWRVDWTTLVGPRVPIAEWAFDTDDDTRTGTAAWPAGAGVTSPGIERALVVSSRAALLIDAPTGRTLATYPVAVDTAARSFVVRVPRGDLPVRGAWRVRLAAGLANSAGNAFAAVPFERGALPGEPAVYNVTFRSREQEPAQYVPHTAPAALTSLPRLPTVEFGNFWNENHQASALENLDVSAFARDIRWSDLAARRSTPEPRPTGYSVRWYASTLDLGQGVRPDSSPTGNLRPNLLGRVQPYTVYVPTGYDPAHPVALTWVLHSLGVNHNQYAATAPRTIQQLCEDRHSICATTLGFGPDGWYFDEAEVDFWQVWHALAATYALDPDRTVISGYSMGGWASYKLGLAYPDLFAAAMPLEGPPTCGVRIAGQLQAAAGSGRCQTDGDTEPLVANARWLPFDITQGGIDELVPVTSGLEQIAAFDAAGLRYHAELYPAEDHIVYSLQDGFSHQIAALGAPQRVRNPGSIHYTWYPHLTRPGLGIGPTGAYWLRDLSADVVAPGTLATVDATSGMRPEPPHTVVRRVGATVPGDPTPALAVDSLWRYGVPPAPAPTLALALTDVRGVAVDMARAGFAGGQRAIVTVRSDRASTVTFLLPGGGTQQVRVAEGEHTMVVG